METDCARKKDPDTMPSTNVHEHIKKEKKNSNYIVCIPVVIMPSIRFYILDEPTNKNDVTLVAYRHSASSTQICTERGNG